ADMCRGGVCLGGPTAVCDDQNVCTLDSCEAATGCRHDAINCDDHDACTVGPDTCDPQTGCHHGALKTCDVGQVCQSPGGECVQKPCSPNGPNTACADGNPCTTDVCENVLCRNAPVADATPCDNTDRCDGRETCQAGVCVPGVAATGGGCQGPAAAGRSGTRHARAAGGDADGVGPPQVVACKSDDDPSTDDVCEAANGCVHRPVSLSLCCHNVGECDDHNGC